VRGAATPLSTLHATARESSPVGTRCSDHGLSLLHATVQDASARVLDHVQTTSKSEIDELKRQVGG
jgi:hypothetical protein